MYYKKRLIKVTLILMFVCSIFLYKVCNANDFSIDYLTTEQGLSQNEVSSIIQDKHGFMWFGTWGGLNRYDGYEFIHHKPRANAKNFISNPSIETVFEDSKGNLWIGTKSGGLNYYDTKTEKFSHITSLGEPEQAIRDNRIISIAEANNGNILIGTWSKGMYVFDIVKNMLTHVLAGKQINKILVHDDNIWIATNRTVYHFNSENQSTKAIDLGSAQKNVTELVIDEQTNTLWMVGWGCGLIAYDINEKSYKTFDLHTDNNSKLFLHNNTYSILKDSKNRLWIGTWNCGLFLFDSKKEVFSRIELQPTRNKSYSSEYDIILDIFEDSNGNIWIGTNAGGVVKLDFQKSFKSVSMEENPDCGLKSFYVNSFWKSPGGELYVGTRGGGLYCTSDNKSFELVQQDEMGSSGYTVTNIYQVSENKVWVSFHTQCYQLDINEPNGKLEPIIDSTINRIRKIRAIAKIDSSLLIGTQQNGLYYISNIDKTNNFRRYTPENNSILKNERITFIKEDSEKRIWLGTFKGIYFFDRNLEEVVPVKFTKDHVLTGDIINCWYQTNDSVFWLGTLSGLNKLTHNSDGTFSVENFYAEKGLVNDYILGILSSNEKEIWVSTNSGIVRLKVNDHSINTFDKSDGIPSLHFTESQGYIANDGTMYFGTNNGYFYFKSKDISTNETIPPIVFTKFKIYNNEIKPGRSFNGQVFMEQSVNSNPKIQLTHKEKEFTIEFAALNFNSPQKNQFAYKMEGYDADWISAGTKHSVTYVGLPPGEYAFNVRGSNNNHIWNEDGATLTISIKAAPWKTWYAFIVYVLLVLGVVSLIRRNAIRQNQLENNLKLEKLKLDQNKTMNEMRLRFFTNISHEFRTPLTLIFAPLKDLLGRKEYFNLTSEAQHKISIAQKNSERLMALVNQLLDFRKIESGNIKLAATLINFTDFLTEVCHPFFELAQINNLKFKLSTKLKNQEVWLDRDKVEVIINNLVSNAIKHVPEKGCIEVFLSETSEHFCLSVSDNGPGIPESDIDNIFERFYIATNEDVHRNSGIGLALTKSYVELHKGKIEVKSKPFEKTEFISYFKKGKAHLGPEEICRLEHTKTSYIKEVVDALEPNVTQSQKAQFDETILVVEDNHEINNFICNLLAPYYKVESAYNGEKGLQLIEKMNPNLILSDVMMPVMDGFEFCKKIRENKMTTTIPFIFLTAKSNEQFRLLGTKLGADDFISKPFNPNLLLEKIKRLLEAREKLQAKYSKTMRLEPSAVEIKPADEIFLQKVIAVVEKNFQNQNFNGDVLARELNMSRSTFYRKLKALTGFSIAEFIRILRLKRAKQLLTDKERTVTEIMYEVGFDDPKYFRKRFQEQFNYSPSEFRKQR